MNIKASLWLFLGLEINFSHLLILVLFFWHNVIETIENLIKALDTQSKSWTLTLAFSFTVEISHFSKQVRTQTLCINVSLKKRKKIIKI